MSNDNKEFDEIHNQAEKLYEQLILTVTTHVQGEPEFQPLAVATASINLLLAAAESLMIDRDAVFDMLREGYRQLDEKRKGE